MKKLVKKAVTERENMVALSTRSCWCGCGCDFQCNCPAVPTHQIRYDQQTSGHTQS